MDGRTEGFIDLLAQMYVSDIKGGVSENAREPYLMILQNMEYVLPYTDKEIIDNMNEKIKKYK